MAKPAQLIEFKYFTNAAGRRVGTRALPGGRPSPAAAEPDAETVEQALACCQALARRPDWSHEIAVTVVEVCGNLGYNWFDVKS